MEGRRAFSFDPFTTVFTVHWSVLLGGHCRESVGAESGKNCDLPVAVLRTPNAGKFAIQ